MSKALKIHESSKYLVQVTIRSRGCRFKRENNSCLMCNYGADTNVTSSELKQVLENELKPLLNGKQRILFGAYGSLLDETEISRECLDIILDFINDTSVNLVIFETHYKTITTDILEYIKSKSNKRIHFEIGLESVNKRTLEIIHKDIDLEKVTSLIETVHKYGMGIEANILLGVPFMSAVEQITDTLSTIQWCYYHKVDSVIVFPINIKPNTELYELYKQGKYEAISSWLLVEVLNNVNIKYIENVAISWYGNRSLKNIIQPYTCSKCKETLMSFYKNYLNASSKEERVALVQEIANKETNCECRTIIISKVYNFQKLFKI